MTPRSHSTRSNARRKGVAAVEAAICLPVLVLIWLAAGEVNQLISLKQQTEILAAMSSDRAVRTYISFEAIEDDTEEMAESLGLVGCDVEMSWFDDNIVETKVSLDFSQNSPTPSFLGTGEVSSTLYVYRKEDS